MAIIVQSEVIPIVFESILRMKSHYYRNQLFKIHHIAATLSDSKYNRRHVDRFCLTATDDINIAYMACMKINGNIIDDIR